jgi:Fic family protein
MPAVESVDRIEPALIEDAPVAITDVVAELAAKAATLGSVLNPRTALNLADFERGEISRITGLPERTARRVLNDVMQEGLLASTTPKGPVSLRFPSDALETLFPRLYVQA